MPLSKPGFPIPREEPEPASTPIDAEPLDELEDNGRKSGISFCGYPEDGGTTPPHQMPAAAYFLQRVPVMRASLADLRVLPLDHRTGFVLSHVDGEMTIEMILDVCAMPSDEVLLILDELIDLGVLRLL